MQPNARGKSNREYAKRQNLSHTWALMLTHLSRSLSHNYFDKINFPTEKKDEAN